VEIVRRRENGKTAGEVRLIDRDAPGPMGGVTRTLRTVQWAGDLPDGPWTFRHHYGLVTVYCGDKRVLAGYADKEPVRNWVGRTRFPPPDQAFFQKCGISEPMEVVGWSLEQEGMPVTCKAVSGNASRSYRESLAPFWRNTLAERRPENLRFGVRDVDNLRTRLERRIPPEGNSEALDSIQSQFEPWEQGEPNLRELTDPSLVHVAQIFGKRHPYYALAVAGVGMQFSWLGNKDEVAERLLKQAGEISEESLGIWHPDCALVLSALARVYTRTGKVQLAEPLLKKVLAASAALGTDSAGYLAMLRELAVVQQYNGRLAAAETTLRQSVELSKDAPRPQRAEALLALGELQARMGEREKAGAALKRTEEMLREEIEHLRSEPVDTYMPLYVPLNRARVRRARILIREGQKEQARMLVRSAFLNLVQFINERGPGPGRFYGWNREILNAVPNGFLRNQPAYALLMIDVAELFLSLGEVVPATGAVRVLDQVPGQTHHERGAIYRLMSHLCAANPNVNLGIRPEFSERMRLDMAFNRQGPVIPGRPAARPKRDRVLYWQKLAQAEFEQFAGREHSDTINLLLDQARRQWRTGRPEAAQPTLLDAFGRAMVLLSDRVLPGLPEAEAFQFSEANPPPTDLLLSCYQATSQEHAREAYEVVWQAKALATRQFAERRQLLQAVRGQPELAKLMEDLQTARQQLAYLSLAETPQQALESRRLQMTALTQRKEDLEREMARLSESVRGTRDAFRARVADLVGRLPEKSAIVDFVEGWQWAPPSTNAKSWSQRRCYHAFVVRPTAGAPGWSAAWVQLEDADGLDRQLEDWVRAVRSRRRPDRRQAEEVRRLLCEPIESALADCRTVILIPDGRLSRIPWAALPGRRPGSFLVEDYALAQAPYGQYVAGLLSEPAAQGEGFLLVGGIDYGPQGKWSYLQGTAAEVKELEQLRPGPQTVRLGGEAATKARLLELLPDRRYVHLATHGEFLDPGSRPNPLRASLMNRTSGEALFDVSARNPLLLSMLVLAGANRPTQTDGQGLPLGSDGFLTAEEVMGVDLRKTELVVLSACETGLGKLRGGEGVFSLQRAFHVSGSRAVVASLWQVPDQATQVLMRRFYENLWHKKMSKLEALRETQLWMLREGAKQPDLARRGLERLPEEGQERKDGSLPPYYWAAFALSGDWR
jgi:CHAT domain-containing protein/tetratricopeptide (TPR) repeat protein